MGFRNGAYATVWDVSQVSNLLTKCRISISRKDKTTGQYEEDFSGFVAFVGTGVAAKAAKLAIKDRIKLGDVDVSTRYDRDKKITYTNYKCFSFDVVDSAASAQRGEANNTAIEEAAHPDEPIEQIESGEPLPF